jgi:hypothetical protein
MAARTLHRVSRTVPPPAGVTVPISVYWLHSRAYVPKRNQLTGTDDNIRFLSITDIPFCRYTSYLSIFRYLYDLDFHGGCYEQCRLLGCYAVWLLVRTDVSEELSASIIRVTRIGELGTLAVTSNRRTLRRNLMMAGAKFL